MLYHDPPAVQHCFFYCLRDLIGRGESCFKADIQVISPGPEAGGSSIIQ